MEETSTEQKRRDRQNRATGQPGQIIGIHIFCSYTHTYTGIHKFSHLFITVSNKYPIGSTSGHWYFKKSPFLCDCKL